MDDMYFKYIPVKILHYPFRIGSVLRLKTFHPRLGFSTYINSSEGSPLARSSFSMAEKWKECRCHVRWDDLEEDIPDNKAFFSCVVDDAKSHLK